MARKDEGILSLLITLPWWVSVVVSAVVYIGMAFILPSITSEKLFVESSLEFLSLFAPYVAFMLLVPAPISAFNAWRKRRLLESQNNISTIRNLGWKQFEELVAEAYRRKGFRVTENDKAGPDGGVDVYLKKNGQLHLVQCKQWRSQKVGVSVVREMYGIMTAEKAVSTIVITSGIFTQEAQSFAEGKAIDLVDGSQLETLVGEVQTQKRSHEQVRDSASCPRCGSELVIRTAKKGKDAGRQFYGCSSYPKCRHTEPYAG